MTTQTTDPLSGLGERFSSLTVRWRFDGANGPSEGALAIEGRIVKCLEQDGTVAWTRSFHTRREAVACFTGDIRAMRKNGLYQWLA